MYHINLAGGQSGPYEMSEVDAMMASGEITPQTLCWTKGWPEWRPVSEVAPMRAEPRVPGRGQAHPSGLERAHVSNCNAVDPARVAKAGVDELLCCRCGMDFGGAPTTKHFTRLRKFACDACGHANTYPPLSRELGFSALGLAVIILVAAQGSMPEKSVLPCVVATLIALTTLTEGFIFRRRVKKSRRFFRNKAASQGG